MSNCKPTNYLFILFNNKSCNFLQTFFVVSLGAEENNVSSLQNGEDTVKLGYNDHGYKEFTTTTN